MMMIIIFKGFIHLFLERGEGRKRGTETSMCGCPLTCPLLGTWPTTQACALAGNQTGDTLVRRPVLSTRSHTSQGLTFLFLAKCHFPELIFKKPNAGCELINVHSLGIDSIKVTQID